MHEEIKPLHEDSQAKPACDNTVSRKEFLSSVLKRAALAGTLLAAPKIIDQFLIPPVYAASSTNPEQDTGSSDTGSTDTGSGDTGSGDTGGGDTGTVDTANNDTIRSDTGSGDTRHAVDCTSPFHDLNTNPFHDHGATNPFHDCINED
jgi:hypothetical protein